jgi:hypothetical protein
LRRRAGGKLRIWAQPCRYRFRFRNLFHVGPYVAAAEPCDLHSRNCRVAAPSRERCSKGSDRTTRARCERWGWFSIQNTKAQPNESTSTAFYIRAQMPISSCRAKVPGKPRVKGEGHERSEKAEFGFVPGGTEGISRSRCARGHGRTRPDPSGLQ